MSKVINNFLNKAKGRNNKAAGKGRGTKADEHSSNGTSEASSPLYESPRSVAGSSVEDLFNKHRARSAYDEEPILVPVAPDGNFRRGDKEGRLGKDKCVGFRNDLDLTEEPSEGDYEDFGEDSGFYDFQQSGVGSFHHSNSNNSSSDHMDEFRNRTSERFQRSQSVQRPMQETSITILQPTVDTKKRRSKSTGRSERRDQITATTLKNYESNRSTANTSNEEPKRKSKMEKIIQLQEKTQRYKDEFRKVQKDRKALKKELEGKKLETASLTKEVDTHVAETFILKSKLSEALQQLDRTELGERKDRSAITKLQKELSAVRGDYNAAVTRIARMREEVESMKVSVSRKDEQIKSLTKEISDQATQVDALHMDMVTLKKQEVHSSINDRGVNEVSEENEKLKAELGSTLQRASSMVKEREEAIADLLKENEEMKRMLAAQEENDNDHIAHEEFLQLRTELSAAALALEESQDRNVMLEEDVETWIAKGEVMESEIQRLRDDLEAWQRKSAAAERSVTVVEASAQESAAKAVSAEAALVEAERRHKEHLHDQERRHTETMLDQKEKLAQQVAASREDAAPPNPQDMMLQKAVADRKAREAAKTGSWSSVLQRVRTAAANGEGEEELSADEKRIKELETINADQENEIGAVKSEMVKLRSTYNDTLYINKKRIGQLEEENGIYAAKQQAMEMELAELRRALASCPDVGSGATVASF